MLPEVMKSATLILDGVPLAGEIENVTLPKLARKGEDYRGGGMLGPVKINLGMEAMQIEFECASSFKEDLLQAFGAPDISGLGGRILAATQADDDGSVHAVELAFRGRIMEWDPGSYKQGDLAKTKVMMPITYLDLRIDGVSVREIDLINWIDKAGDQDYSADLRRALGMFSEN